MIYKGKLVSLNRNKMKVMKADCVDATMQFIYFLQPPTERLEKKTINHKNVK